MIELLNAGHVPNGFDSGEPEINDFLIRLARVHTEAGYSPATQQVQGFVSMAASSQPVRLASAGDTKALLGERLSSSPFNRVPVLLIAYWEVQKDLQGRGIGNELLNFAFKQVVSLAGVIGITGIVIEALTEALVPRYQKLGFVLLPHPDREKRRMFMDMPYVVAAVEATKM